MTVDQDLDARPRSPRRVRSVPYTFTVTNTGNVTLTGVTVADPKCTRPDQRPDRRHQHRRQAADHRDLGLHAARTPSRQAEIDAGGNLSNTVTVDSAESAPDTDTLNIPVAQAPALRSIKSSTHARGDRRGSGGAVHFTVTNTGNRR